MSAIEGKNVCDRCGVDVGNAGLDKCVVAADLVDGMVVNYHFCRENGCAGKVLSKRNLERRLILEEQWHSHAEKAQEQMESAQSAQEQSEMEKGTA